MYTYIFIDESGNLGMNSKEHYFVLSALKIPSDEESNKSKRILKKIRYRKLKKKLKQSPELKFSNTSKDIRVMILEELNKLDVEVHSVIIDKRSAKLALQNNLPILYSYLIKILLEKVLQNIPNKKLYIVLDRCMNKSQRENFGSYVKTQFLSLFSVLPEVEIIHKNSEEESGLQLVDFVSGAFGYKYNTMNLQNDCNFYVEAILNILKTEKNDLFKPK